MSESLGTRDVLEQVDARLGNVEQDLRLLRSEVRTELQQLGNRLDIRIDTTTRWLVGLMLLSWLSLMASIWLRP